MKKLFFIFILNLVLCGCSETFKRIDENTENGKNVAQESMEKLNLVETRPIIKYLDKPILFMGKGTPVDKLQRLPKKFYEKGLIGINESKPISIQKVVQFTRKQTGFAIIIDPDVFKISEDFNEKEKDSDKGSLLSKVEQNKTNLTVNNFDTQLKKEIRFHGNLYDFLDYICSVYDITWEWEDNRIYLKRFETREFILSSFSESSNFSTSVSGGEAGSQSSGGTMSFNHWDSIVGAIKGMLSPFGKITESNSIGIVVVTDTPKRVKKIDEFIKEINGFITQQMLLKVRILAVAIDDSDSRANNWMGILKTPNNDYTFGGGSSLADAVGGITKIITGDTSVNGSTITLESLERQSNVATITSINPVVINNHPVPIRLLDETSYIEKVENTVSDGVISQSITNSTISTGLNLHLVAKTSHDGRILVKSAFNISSLVNMKTFESNDGSIIQTPEIEKKAFENTNIIKDGEIMIISGFEQMMSRTNLEGILNKNLWAAGGKKLGNQEKITLIVVVQPILL